MTTVEEIAPNMLRDEPVAWVQITPFVSSDHFGAGSSDDAQQIRKAQGDAFLDLQRGRALPNHLTLLSPEARVAVDTRWSSDVCEAMFEFLAVHYPGELIKLVSGNVLSPPAMTFAAEIVGRTPSSPAVRAALLPLLDHESPLVREGAIYGLREHADAAVTRKLMALAGSDPSPAIRHAASDTLDQL
jgi:HEAT repeat protein